MKYLIKLGWALMVITIFISCKSKEMKQTETNTERFEKFVTHYENIISPLSTELTTAMFTASVTGSEEDFQKSNDLEVKLNEIHSNKEDFLFLKEIKESNEIEDPILLRELDVIYNRFLSKQTDELKLNAITKLENDIRQKYNQFRAEVGTTKLTDNEVEEILKTETNSTKLQKTWEGHKQIGNVVAEDIIKLVKLRNEIAQELGFSNFHEMSLKLNDQDPKDVELIFDELDELTKNSYAQLKGEIDEYLAKRYKITKDELMPWHYQNRYFQEAPKMYEVDLDAYYKEQNIEKLTIDYYTSIGLDITDIIQKSDLYEKEGKDQHAFCIDIDNAGDVRILCNIQPNYNWMNTMLHEFGHGVYDKYSDMELPYVLREPAHTFTTEAIAMFFGRMAANPNWMVDMGLIDQTECGKITTESFNTLRLEQLVFSRWAQVMYRFEKSMYENPDQDLNQLWWDMVEKYQLVKKPEGRNQPDWASKSHIATAPCYYHNYLLGELLASQFHYYIVENILKSEDFGKVSFVNNKEIGTYFLDNVFKPGAKWYWNDMIEKATGEKLTAKYYAKQFVNVE